MRRFLIALCFAPLAFAATSGVVLNTTTGDPIAGARVSVRRPGTPFDRQLQVLENKVPAPLATATTNDEGAFSLDAKVDGVLSLQVERDGFAPAFQFVLANANDISVSLTPAAQRRGRVVADGKPVANATIAAYYADSLRWITKTDEQGAFSMPEPKSWCSSLVVLHPDHAPHSLDVAAPGKSLDATLVKGKSFHGKVVDAAQKPVANARVIAGWSTTLTKDDGTFTLAHVEDKPEQIEAFLANASGSAKPGAETTTITIQPRPTISGTVRDANKRPVAGMAIAAYTTASRNDPLDVRYAVSDERGAYRVEHLTGSKYTVSAVPPAELTYESLNSIAAGAKNADLIATPARAVTGIVVDEQKRPVANATVQFTIPNMPLIYGTNAVERMPRARSGRDGRFRLMLSDELPTFLQQSAMRVQAFHRRYAAGASDDIDPASPVTIVLPAGIEVEGIVVDSKGNGVANAAVVVMQGSLSATPLPLDSALASGTITPFLVSDAEGKFTLHLNPEPHDFGAWKQGTGSARIGNVAITSGAPPVKLVLQAGQTIRGRVLRGSEPVSGGMIMATGPNMSYAAGQVGDDGTFILESLSEGPHQVQFMGMDGQNVEKTVTAPADDVVLSLEARGTVHGRVIDAETRQVLRNYEVSVESGMFDSTEVDGADEFTLEVNPGDVELIVEAEGYQRATQLVSVQAAKTSEVTVAITRGRKIFGRVTAEDGTPVSDATVQFSSDSAITDDDGTYELTVPRDETSLEVQATGYVRKEAAIPNGTGEARVDFVLSRGRAVRGRVLTSEGEPVGRAHVSGWAASGGYQETTTDEDGAFTMQGFDTTSLQLNATRDVLSSGPVTVDLAKTTNVEIRMKPSAGVGTVIGVLKGFEGSGFVMATVTAGSSHALVGRDGRFRVERVAAGEVEVRAMLQSADSSSTTTRPVKVNVVANSEVEVTLELTAGTSVRGTVIEGGAPAGGRNVQFTANEAYVFAQTNANGEYVVNNLEPGVTYIVRVSGGGNRMFTTRYTASGAGRFDIRIEWTRIEGRVVDTSGNAIAGAQIEIEAANDSNNTQTTKSDVTGAFLVTMPQASSVIVRAEKSGYASATQQITPTAATLLLTMSPSAGLRVRLVDARSGQTLSGYAVAIDDAGRLLARTSDSNSDGTLSVPVAAGTYRIAVSASDYASQSARTTVPRDGELRFALTPGGTLIVNTDRASNDVIKLVQPSGEEYVRCQCNGIAEIRLTGTTTTVDHVAPGGYTMQVLDERGLVKASHQVAVVEGQTSAITIHIPE